MTLRCGVWANECCCRSGTGGCWRGAASSTRRRSSPKSGGGGGESSLGAGEIPNFGEVVRGGHPQDGTGHGPALFRSACEMTTEIDPQIGMEQVKALVDLGRFDRALPLAERLVATGPDDAR